VLSVSFGENLIAGAVLAGVFDLRCLERAQEENHLSLFWQHDLGVLADFATSVQALQEEGVGSLRSYSAKLLGRTCREFANLSRCRRRRWPRAR
jgi:hypothetical protein